MISVSVIMSLKQLLGNETYMHFVYGGYYGYQPLVSFWCHMM